MVNGICLCWAHVIYIFFDMVTLYFTFIAAGNPIRIIDLLAGYGLPLLMGKAAFVLPGGLGIIEATMAAIYSGIGVPSTVALAVVLVYRFITFWAPTVLGFIIMVILYQMAERNSDLDQPDRLKVVQFKFLSIYGLLHSQRRAACQCLLGKAHLSG